MPQIEKSTATLRMFGDDLVPEDISRLLGCVPTKSEKKGEVIVGKETGHTRIARNGGWWLRAAVQEPENLDKQISEILSKVTDDLNIWRELNSKYRIDLFCGLFMGNSNDGLTIRPKSLVALGQRGIKLDLDIYDAPKLDVPELVKKAEQGDTKSQYKLGQLYDYGNERSNIKQDYAEAAKWFLMAAEQGHADAQFEVGVLYSGGYGVTKDWVEAVKWYCKAEAQGLVHAQLRLSGLYVEGGYGIKQDKAEAIKWLQKAADQGSDWAKKKIEEMKKE